MKQPCLIVFLTLLIQISPAFALLTVDPIFGNDMVLPQGEEIPVWGEADPGAKVMVYFEDQVKSTHADDEGNWQVTLDPTEANDDGQILEIQSGTTTETFSGVVVGEVWLAVGQTSMGWPIDKMKDGRAVMESADIPLLRFNHNRKDGWKPCEPDFAREFSALAYFFGRSLHEAQPGVPVGVIVRASGGSAIESWMPLDNLVEIPFCRRVHALAQDDAFQEKLDAYRDDMRAWYKLSSEEKARQGKPEFKFGEAGLDVSTYGIYRLSNPGGAFRKELLPLSRYPIRGAIFSMGARNAQCGPKAALAYREQLPALVSGWREAWEREDLPFIYLQLSNNKGEPGWFRIQESQAKAAKEIPHSGMATLFDAGRQRGRPLPDHQVMGERLARLARANVYGENVPSVTGPQFEEATFEADRVVLSFEHIGLGLVAAEEGLTGFQVAGADRDFVDAEAAIEGTRVIVTAPEGVRPVAVRYGWVEKQQASLFNADNLPASPFRTDDWEE